ncbi:hypothetical protein K456DRAFT_59673 [Colletotrichum gloeosporioides 23]|nr:hypothetical protein K456DRAFT_59673 [Colletotrichum gloeosporioides 23]
MPCSYYRSSRKHYKLLPRGEVCGECTCLGRSYDAAADTIYALDRLLDEAARLEDAEVAEEEVLRKKAAALRAAQAELDESMARLDRLRKQKRMVFRKGREVTEEEPVASSVSEVQSMGGFGAIDLDAVLGDWNLGTPNFLSGES